MAMRRAAIVLTLFGVAFAVPARSQVTTEGMPREACLSSAESRDLFVADKLVQPFGVMRESAHAMQAEAIDIQLCRAQGKLVYDVTLLDPRGLVLHRLVEATSGVPLAAPPAGSAPPPRLPAGESRPGPGPYPGIGPNFYYAPRMRPNYFQGPRPGPYMFQGPRPGAPFFPGMRPLERGP